MNNSEGQTQEPVGGMLAIVKEICSDFMFENSNRISGYKAVRKLFDDWFSNNPYWQNKLSSPPPAPVGIDVDALANDKYPERFEQCNGTLGMYGLCDVNYYNREAFKSGYSASLPQSSTGGLPKLDQPILDEDDVKGIIESESSTEEEKDLWNEIANVLYGFEMGRRFDINELLSTYKITKR